MWVLMSEIDIVTVYHNSKNYGQSLDLLEKLDEFESGRFTFIPHSNIENNLGFAKGCNIAAAQGSSPIIGFLNPDVNVLGPFVNEVTAVLNAGAKITGERFGKPDSHLKIWGVKDWVCGATFFTTREHWVELGGFDERFVWSFEETDFIRRTEALGGCAKSINLPLSHSSPNDDSVADIAYKDSQFALAQRRYYEKWKG